MTDTPDLHTLAAEAMRGNTVRTFQEAADAVLAAVLPAAAAAILAVGDSPTTPIEQKPGLYRAANIVKRLASAAPETAPRSRQDDETAPAVGREAAQAQGAAEGAAPDRPRTWQLPDDRERAKAAIHQPLHDLNVRIVDLAVGDCHCNLIAEVVLDALTDVTPADGQDGDGHG